ncbi:M23 family metallopeptidase [Corynebacterium sp.]|uniref:M23 family metallopeptidase n=1 Tax=Corynebacterium sp. TaxID=1720 RepID=UPI0019858941|nr:M23 family metallopeptidase [Corynebacterium sp.]HHU67699.1 M23 family metallopeptidase [Corynebacterium sp.]
MSYIGRHRKPSTTSKIQRRLAIGALVAGTVTTAGMSSVSTAAATEAAPDFAGMSSAATGAVTQAAQAVQVTQIAEAIAPAPSVVRPTTGTFTSGYGPRWGTMHNGIDIANSIGTPIYAVMAGTVIDSGPASGYGQWIRIRHDDGSVTVYGHMETLNVSVGQRVSAGQHIAGMGNRGFSTGSHLHFEIHPAGSGPVDPVPWFGNHGIYF